MHWQRQMRRRIPRGLALSAVLITLAAIGYRFFFFGERAVTAALNSIPGVRVQWVSDDADLIPDWYQSRIDVAGAPSAYIFGLTRESFGENGAFCFFQVGDYAVRWTAYGNFWGPGFQPQPTGSNSFCFNGSGTDSDGLDLFPVRIRNVRVLAAATNSTVVAGENPTVGSTVWLAAESVAPGR